MRWHQSRTLLAPISVLLRRLKHFDCKEKQALLVSG